MQAQSKSQRRYDIDAIRVLAVLLLIYFHSARAFDFEPWHVRNDELSWGLDLFVTLVSPWHMPLLFLLAGASTFYALGFRSAKQYVGERSRRLLIPLLFGAAVVIPPQVYFERIGTWVTTRLSPINFNGSFIEFYPRFFTCCYPKGNLTYQHLWFILYLFIFSLLALPLFLGLRTEAGERIVSKLAAFFERGRAIFLLAVPIAVIEVALRAWFPNWQDLIHDWANNFHYLTIFIYGYLLVADARFGRAIAHNKGLALGLGILASAAYLVVGRFMDAVPYAAEEVVQNALRGEQQMMLVIAGYVVQKSLRAFGEWCWLVAILGYGQQYLNKESKVLRYASEMAYPFYIWHQTVIVTIGFYVLQWQAGVAVKYLAISIASLVMTILLCELVKLTNVTRFLFGMKPKVRMEIRGL